MSGFTVWKLESFTPERDLHKAEWAGPKQGERGGTYWVNMATNKKFYGDKPPGGGGAAEEDPAAAQQAAQEDPARQQAPPQEDPSAVQQASPEELAQQQAAQMPPEAAQQAPPPEDPSGQQAAPEDPSAPPEASPEQAPPAEGEAAPQEGLPAHESGGGLLGGGAGGPGILGMTRAQVQQKMQEASQAGHNETNPIDGSVIDDPKIDRKAWKDLWDELFPFMEPGDDPSKSIDMNRVPDGNIDPSTVVINWERLAGDPHATTFMRYTTVPKSDNGQPKTQTCNTVENLVQNDIKRWPKIRELMGATESREGEAGLQHMGRHGEEVLAALQGDLAQGTGNESLQKIHDLNTHLRGQWQDATKTTRERDSAAVNQLIMATGKRRGQVGNYDKAKAKAPSGKLGEVNRGITTLHAGDIKINGDNITAKFTGKGGTENTFSIQDGGLANYISERQSGKGPEDRLFEAHDGTVDMALAEGDSPTSKPKDFRTMFATAHAMQEFSKAGAPMHVMKKAGDTMVYKDKNTKIPRMKYKEGNVTVKVKGKGKKGKEKEVEMSHEAAHQAGHLGKNETMEKTGEHDIMSFKEAHEAGHKTDKQAMQRSDVHIPIQQALEQGIIDHEGALQSMAEHILGVVKNVQTRMNHGSAKITTQSYIHPEVFQQYLDHHGFSDMIPPVLNPYAKHSRNKAFELLQEFVRPFYSQGYRVMVKAFDAPEDENSKHPMLGDYEEDEDPEEDFSAWPPWFLKYAMNPEQRAALRRGEEVDLNDCGNKEPEELDPDEHVSDEPVESEDTIKGFYVYVRRAS